MRKKAISLISLLALPVAYAESHTGTLQSSFDRVFDMITPDIANYIYTFVLVFAVTQFALNLVMQQAGGKARGAASAMNPSVIAAALGFGAGFFTYVTKFDMILFTIPWIMIITFALMGAMVYRVAQLFSSGKSSAAMRSLGIGISLILSSAFLESILSYIEKYKELSPIDVLSADIVTPNANLFFGTLSAITGWMLIIGVGFLGHSVIAFLQERGSIPKGLTDRALDAVGISTPSWWGGHNDPNITMTATPNTGAIGDDITFSNTSTPGPGNTMTEWVWNFGPGATPTDETVTTAPGNPSADVTYSSDGAKTVTLTVKDSENRTATDTVTVTITPGGGGGNPTARYLINSGAIIVAGRVDFDATTSTDVAGDDHTKGNLEIYWNFNGAGARPAYDGTTNEPPTVDGDFLPGNYTINLKVVDIATKTEHEIPINFTVVPV
jgi:hypothetical protein